MTVVVEIREQNMLICGYYDENTKNMGWDK